MANGACHKIRRPADRRYDFFVSSKKINLYSTRLYKKNWYERGDLNPYRLPYWILSPARLPVPPLSRVTNLFIKHFLSNIISYYLFFLFFFRKIPLQKYDNIYPRIFFDDRSANFSWVSIENGPTDWWWRLERHSRATWVCYRYPSRCIFSQKRIFVTASKYCF